MSLGDFLPPHLRAQLADEHLRVGSVIRTMVSDTKPPKVKFYVIIGFTDDKLALGAVYINTEINPNKFHSPQLAALHLPVKLADNPFLLHDSFIDCSQIIEKQFEQVKQLLTNTPDCHKGELDEGLLKSVFKTLHSAKTIAKRVKDRYRLDLKG